MRKRLWNLLSLFQARTATHQEAGASHVIRMPWRLTRTAKVVKTYTRAMLHTRALTNRLMLDQIGFKWLGYVGMPVHREPLLVVDGTVPTEPQIIVFCAWQIKHRSNLARMATHH